MARKFEASRQVIKLGEKKNQWIVLALVLSGALNLIFLSIFFYFLVRDNPFPLAFDFNPAPLTSEKPKTISNPTMLRALSKLSYPQLLDKLSQTTLAEEGYCERDLALAVLHQKFHFDVYRALGKKQLSSRLIAFDQKTLTLFPDLDSCDFAKIKTFVAQERFPFTSQGLFLALKKMGLSQTALAATFTRTPEFLLVQMLFQKTPSLKKKWLLALILEGDWKTLENFYNAQKQACHLTDETRQQLLCSYLLQNSSIAAQLLLLTDREFCLKYLKDSDLCIMLAKLPSTSAKTHQLAQDVLSSSRGDQVQRQARALLENRPLAQIRPPRASTGQLRPVFRDRPPSSPTPQQHIIQKGETLSSIAHKYQVSEDALMRLNHLPSPNIHAGNILKLP